MAWLRKNIHYHRPIELSAWRRVALHSWRTAKDPSIYGMMEVDIEPSLAYLEKLRSKSSKRITLTHIIGRMMAEIVHQTPELNCVQRWGKLYPRKSVDVFFQVATDEKGKDLTGLVIREADRKTVEQISDDMEDKVSHIRKHNDPNFKQMKGLIRFLPVWFTPALLTIGEWLSFGLNIWSPLLGYPRDAFGSIMVTNIGSLGMNIAFAPLVPYSRVPIIVTLGGIEDKAVVDEGQIRVQKRLTLTVTIDHRVIDGVHAARMVKLFKKLLKDPESLTGLRG